ncbi:hypothetical protein ABFS82_10G101700 [Erythranthe guttata]|uniref:DUF4005 domain-containing protein n=1 Tax=Erythranthe guttata TaxID=4155 RepID=A0A022QJ04_ERYGU|nr:PREDICTED: uncharacterized protein LOC105969313 [Erythranthe guttata]EYU27263.1 hypothetical protein MIMGU_mgv1a007196mg [Erythranthe guttata]|eukprot:XP_012849519.1 PREDICTED: uncharacterized protein LOC105969313 [Erythranthe guttata]
MGRATRWFKDLFGIKSRDKDTNEYSGRDAAAGFCHNPTTIPPNITPAEAAWLRSFYGDSDSDRDQNKHAIAVAAATAAAADAAVAAAQAAVAVVRLTSQGRGTAVVFGGSREKWAAVKIQTLFRGYLARKALRALRGLVKIQALVRGFLVRKEAAATLYSMQALLRAQKSVRAHKMRTRPVNINQDNFPPLQFLQARTSLEKKYEELERSEHCPTTTVEESPKIVEVDMGCRPKSRSRRANSGGEDSFGKTIYNSPLVKSRLPVAEARNIPDLEWGLMMGEECHFSTAQSTPRFATSTCVCGGGGGGTVTPAKSACTESEFRRYGGEKPNYMAKTKSFKAKVRSQSAPKQRAEVVVGPRRRLTLQEMMESRNSLSGVRMQRSCSQAQDTVLFKNAVMGNLARSSDFVTQNNFYPN